MTLSQKRKDRRDETENSKFMSKPIMATPYFL